jgi:hypothetical protein
MNAYAALDGLAKLAAACKKTPGAATIAKEELRREIRITEEKLRRRATI